MINDEVLNLVSGGVLLEGWDKTLFTMMKYYKSKYGDEGIQKVKDLMNISLKDPTSKVEESDMDTLYNFIDENWNNA
jgi:hypothetical protein